MDITFTTGLNSPQNSGRALRALLLSTAIMCSSALLLAGPWSIQYFIISRVQLRFIEDVSINEFKLFSGSDHAVSSFSRQNQLEPVQEAASLILNPYRNLLNPLHSLMLPVHTTAFHIIRESINSFLFSEIILWFLRSHVSVFLLVSPPFPDSWAFLSPH